MGDTAKLRRRLNRKSRKLSGFKNVRNATKGLAVNLGLLQRILDCVIEELGLEDKIRDRMSAKMEAEFGKAPTKPADEAPEETPAETPETDVAG